MSSFGSKIPKELQEELKRRELISSRALDSVYIPGAGKDAEFADYASKSHYAIMSTRFVDETRNKAIGAGEIVARSGGLVNMSWGFKADGKGAYRNTLDEGGSGAGIRPVAGITAITSEYTGQQFFTRDTTVNWIAPSLETLQEFGPFLTIGESVVVQWGFVGAKTVLDANESFITIYDDRISINEDVFTSPRKRVLRANGNMDGVGGSVSDFSFKLRDDGGFDCTTHIKSVGHNIFSKDGRTDDMQGLSAVLPSDVQNKLQQIANGLVPDKIIDVIDDITGQVKQAVSFLDPNSDEGSEKVSQTEDHLLNAILNLDTIAGVHMGANQYHTVVYNGHMDEGEWAENGDNLDDQIITVGGEDSAPLVPGVNDGSAKTSEESATMTNHDITTAIEEGTIDINTHVFDGGTIDNHGEDPDAFGIKVLNFFGVKF